MATLSAPPASGVHGGLIDPTKPAEYPILLGDKLAGKQAARDTGFINVTYNYKTKGGSPQQRTKITAGSSQDLFKLTIQDKVGNAEQSNLTYIYNGSVDPNSLVSESESNNLVLIFDPKRKAFILEPVSTRLNFNLQSAPGKSERQVANQYPPLNVLNGEDQRASDDGQGDGEADFPGDADESNPYDYRHFLPKTNARGEGTETSVSSTPEHHIPSSTHLTPSVAAAAKLKPKAPPKSKPQTNPLRPQPKRVTKPTTNGASTSAKIKPKPKPAPRPKPVEVGIEAPPLEEESKPELSALSPGNNVVADSYLTIDYGSPPPERPKIKLNPRDFSSNTTPANEAENDEDEDEPEDPRFPSPFRPPARQTVEEDLEEEDEDEESEEDPDGGVQPVPEEADMSDDDGFAAEMEAALEESAREEEEERARNQLLQQQQQQQRQHIVSDDESEVSEEE